MILTVKNILGINIAKSGNLWRLFSQSVALPFLVLIASLVVGHMTNSELGTSLFYGFKYILIVATLLPFYYFGLKERQGLFLSLFTGFVFILLYDQLHEISNSNFSAVFRLDEEYRFINLISIPFYFLLLGASLIAKSVFVKYSDERSSLISELEESRRLVEVQRQELEQRELSSATELKLLVAQNEEIESMNSNLRNKLITKNNLLKHTNEELIKHTGELRQFSFMVSHNLRAPVAALKGLFNLINERQNGDNDLIGKVGEVLVNLDNLMYDLNKITNIRNEVYRTKEKVNLKEELENIKGLLQTDIEAFDVQIESDFSSQEHIYSVKSIVNSILFNLVSNGIKYHSKSVQPRIQLRTEETDGFTILKVKDYGIGLDTVKNKKNLFRLYSRFNQDVEGRGIGLYLCKMQIESLGGQIDVASEVGEWTEFTVKFENSMDANRQVFFENRSAIIYHDEDLGMNTVSWKDDIVFGSYKEIYSHIVALQAQYLSKRWVIDCSEQGHIPTEFHLWMQRNIVPSLDISLKEIHLILNDRMDKALREEVKKTVRLLEKQDVSVSLFETKEDFLLQTDAHS
ncbi:MAG: HAMP domain-containing sensor histidine kinase [Cyclobacteriaceae bacterium]